MPITSEASEILCNKGHVGIRNDDLIYNKYGIKDKVNDRYVVYPKYDKIELGVTNNEENCEYICYNYKENNDYTKQIGIKREYKVFSPDGNLLFEVNGINQLIKTSENNYMILPSNRQNGIVIDDLARILLGIGFKTSVKFETSRKKHFDPNCLMKIELKDEDENIFKLTIPEVISACNKLKCILDGTAPENSMDEFDYSTEAELVHRALYRKMSLDANYSTCSDSLTSDKIDITASHSIKDETDFSNDDIALLEEISKLADDENICVPQAKEFTEIQQTDDIINLMDFFNNQKIDNSKYSFDFNN